MVATDLSGERNRPEAGEYVMSAEAVADDILKAVGQNQYEVALGAAANLLAEREAMFSAINR
jgi:short-subunit dehydrogenase